MNFESFQKTAKAGIDAGLELKETEEVSLSDLRALGDAAVQAAGPISLEDNRQESPQVPGVSPRKSDVQPGYAEPGAPGGIW